MFVKLFKEGYLNIEKLLLDKYVKLGLSENELIVLIQLLNLNLSKKSISFKLIKSKVAFTMNKLNEIIDSLVSKGFVGIEVSMKNDKQDCVLNPQMGLEKIIEYLENEKKLESLEENENQIKKIAKLCEEELCRTLSSNDLITISHWVEKGIAYDTIKWAIFDSIKSGRSSISYIDRVISNGEIEEDY